MICNHYYPENSHKKDQSLKALVFACKYCKKELIIKCPDDPFDPFLKPNVQDQFMNGRYSPEPVVPNYRSYL